MASPQFDAAFGVDKTIRLCIEALEHPFLPINDRTKYEFILSLVPDRNALLHLSRVGNILDPIAKFMES